jgi:hypothetical protein
MTADKDEAEEPEWGPVISDPNQGLEYRDNHLPEEVLVKDVPHHSYQE